MPDPVCGNCLHWKEQPRPRDESGAVDMSVPRTGQCRYDPPQLTILPQPGGIAQLCDFALIRDSHPSCSHFSPQTATSLSEDDDSVRWWRETAREIKESVAQGADFTVDCLLAGAAERLGKADALERRQAVTVLLGLAD